MGTVVAIVGTNWFEDACYVERQGTKRYASDQGCSDEIMKMRRKKCEERKNERTGNWELATLRGVSTIQ